MHTSKVNYKNINTIVFTPNSQKNHLWRALQAPLQEPLQYCGWIIFVLQHTKRSCHATVKVIESYKK